jgi:hypothetical protein
VNAALVLTTFAVVLPAELPVFLGVAAAFAVHVCVAVAVGGAGRAHAGGGRARLTATPALATPAPRGHPDTGMVRYLLVSDRALDFGRVVTCGCPGVRGPRSPRRGPRIG